MPNPRHEQRTRELMLSADESRRYIAIYSSLRAGLPDYGICPDCGASVPFYETRVCTHVRTHVRICKGKPIQEVK